MTSRTCADSTSQREGWRSSSGRKVSVVGPLVLRPDTPYTARYMRPFSRLSKSMVPTGRATGTRDPRRALVLVLHRSDQPYSMAVDDHRSHGAPHAQWTPQATCPK